ncbi:cysteine proteinase [Schizophyllum commune H4-8]|uniref:USP domain-containing protein n=1 Tax=Schizophyllum commune (strain H4-8 / FGSC 9210) TaxID=578458 RepID=D8QJ54_SCHCM|nr:cysteine proteinase [Schizophyllum commune H4-8]KAI5886481.1 cysteine proteinase [Schizophyllum commune H4-8]
MYAKDTAPFVPTEIIGNMTKFTELSPYRQEDAQEFLQAVINHLDHTTSSAIDSSLVEQVFQGSERYRRECAACGQREDRFQPFRTLRLNLKETVEAALKELTSKQAVEDASCDGCNRRGHRSETNTIHDAPRILALQLKRFTHVLTKLSGSCGYTEILDIEPYMSTSNTDPTASTQHNDRPSTLYRLYAVVCHIGPAIHQGHYLAWVKTGEGKWAIMNDSSVIVTDTLSASEEDGYLFFYERVDGAEAEALRADMQVPQEAANLRRRARQTLANVRGPLAATEEGWTTVQVRKQRAKQEQPKADKGSQEKREKHASSGKGKGERKGKKQTRTTR